METKTNIHVKLIGEDSNIYNLIGICRTALRRNKKGDLVEEFTNYITASSSFDEALARIMEWFIVE